MNIDHWTNKKNSIFCINLLELAEKKLREFSYQLRESREKTKQVNTQQQCGVLTNDQSPSNTAVIR